MRTLRFIVRLAAIASICCVLLQPMLGAGTASAAVPQPERDALVELYDKLQGDGWFDRTGWKQGDPCSTQGAWFGVQCNDERTHVVALHLLGNRLAGNLGELALFKNLTELGQLEFGNNFGILSDRWNHLEGTLPPDFGTLGKLYYVDLRFNAIQDRLDAFTSLINLKHLELEENLFAGSIPPTLGALAQLDVLTLNGNRLSGSIPSELGDLSKLTKLWLYNNQLEGTIPASLGKLSALTELRMGGNPLTGSIPSSLGDLQSLQILELGLAFLDGDLPPELSKLGELHTLSLGTNRLVGNLDRVDWPRMTKLEKVYLDTNRFSGTLPAGLAQLPALKVLHLRANSLHGDVPGAYLDLLQRNSDLDLRWNALDPSTEAAQLLDSRSGGQFSATQTVAPRTDTIAVARRSSTSLFVTWQPIALLDGQGGYRIAAFTDPVTSSAPLAETVVSGKESSSALLSGVPAGAAFVRIRSFTDAHSSNPTPVESEWSEAVPIDSATGKGIATFERSRYAIREGDSLTLGVLRVDGTAGSLAAKLSAESGTATEDDFAPPKPASLSWASGITAAKTVTLPTVGDNRTEPIETMELLLTSPAGKSQATVEIGDRTVAGTAQDPVIATNPEGLSFLAWVEPQKNSSLRNVKGRFRDTQGRLGATIDVAVASTLDEYDPDVVALDDGLFEVAWVENDGDDSDSKMRSCRPNYRGKKCARRILSSAVVGLNGMTMAPDGNAFWLAWTTPDGLFVQRSTQTEAVLLATPEPESGRILVEPRLVVLNDSRLAAIWVNIPEVSGPDFGGSVEAQVFSSGGQLVGERYVFEGAAASQRLPRAVGFGEDHAFVAWAERGKTSIEGPQQLAWSVISADGSKGPVERISIASGTVVDLETVQVADECEVIWLTHLPAGGRIERQSVSDCLPGSGSQSRPPLDTFEGHQVSFAASAVGDDLLLVEELVAHRGVRWLTTTRFTPD
jgi:hypothetical protein